MKKVLLFLIFYNSVYCIYAQQIQTVSRTLDRTTEMNSLKLQTNGIITLADFSSRAASDKLLNKLGIEGSPYEKEDSTMGYFYLGSKIIQTPTRLNYYLNRFEFMENGKVYVATANTIDSVVMDSATYVYRFLKDKGKDQPKIVKVIGHFGENFLYKYKTVIFKPQEKPGPFVELKKAHFEWSEPIFYFELNNKLISLSSFKELIKNYSNREKDIQKYINENSITKSNPEKLKKLLSYISQL